MICQFDKCTKEAVHPITESSYKTGAIRMYMYCQYHASYCFMTGDHKRDGIINGIFYDE